MTTTGGFDPGRYRWREVTGDPASSYFVHHDYTILGHDLEAGSLDMVVRWGTDGGHCPIHRHTATTSVLVLEGEQHLWDVLPDGSRGDHRVRRAGDYALTSAEALPHLECGGSEGGVVYFGARSSHGKLYEIIDEDGQVIVDVTMTSLLADFAADAADA